MYRKRFDLLDKVRVVAGRDVRHEPPGFAHVTIVVWTVYMPDIRFVQKITAANGLIFGRFEQ